jgi:DNA-binding response OmpR family regulator
VNENKILVVDDEAPIRDILEKAFSRIGYSVRSAASGEEALEILEHEYFPVIFIDLGLETMTGFELCEQIRKDSSDAIIYAITGYAKLLGEHEILEAGFDDCFVKPIKLETLYQAVKDAFEKIEKMANNPTPNNSVIERILIIADDEQFRRVLGKMLEVEGFEVITVSDRDEGVKRQSEQPADLIITDIMMPKKNGIETILDIQEVDPKARFIAVSGRCWYGSSIELDMAKTLGAVSIEKPFKRKELLEAIKQLQN